MLVLSGRVDDSNPVPGSLPQFNQLVDRRLAIAAKGLSELRAHLAAGQKNDAQVILEKLNEDLHLLRRRLHHEVETATPSASTLYDSVNAASHAN